VNQQRHVVEEILDFGREHGVGLEVGSKPELQAVLAISERTDHIIVCNGYKDEEFIRLALMGQKLGHTGLHRHREDQRGRPPAEGGRGDGRGADGGRPDQARLDRLREVGGDGGERSKFGLNASQLVLVLDKLEAAGQLDILKLIHFHLGSQIPTSAT
jgi:arginine decarboxylase